MSYLNIELEFNPGSRLIQHVLLMRILNLVFLDSNENKVLVHTLGDLVLLESGLLSQ